jgi:hypothetical protein
MIDSFRRGSFMDDSDDLLPHDDVDVALCGIIAAPACIKFDGYRPLRRTGSMEISSSAGDLVSANFDSTVRKRWRKCLGASYCGGSNI